MTARRNLFHGLSLTISHQQRGIEIIHGWADMPREQIHEVANSQRSHTSTGFHRKMLFAWRKRCQIGVPDDDAGWNARVSRDCLVAGVASKYAFLGMTYDPRHY